MGVFQKIICKSTIVCTLAVVLAFSASLVQASRLKVSGNKLSALIIPRMTDLRYYPAVFRKLKARILD